MKIGTNEGIARACVTVMAERGVTLDMLRKRVPRGFWERVIENLPEGSTTPSGEPWSNKEHLSAHWKRNQGEIAGFILRYRQQTDTAGLPADAVTDAVASGSEETTPSIVVRLDTEELQTLDILTGSTGDADERPEPLSQPKPAFIADRPFEEVQADALLDTSELIDTLKSAQDRIAETRSTAEPDGTPLEEAIMAKVTARIEVLEARLTTSLVNKIRIFMETQNRSAADSFKDEDPPVPQRLGRRFRPKKTYIHAKIDKNLFEILDRESRAKHEGNISRALDAILWRYYGKPKLSFETPE
ncbi:MAG: hypothetical protein HY914_21875 [Desulfomonile tiedjei]|nr:hypothetical protein [Desulfomonile tiedjei]